VRRRRAWRYCVSGRRNRTAKVVAVFTRRARVGLVASTGRGHEALGIAPGARARRLRGRARPFGRGVFVRRAGGGAGFVYGVRRGRVRYVGVASRSVARRPARLRRHLRIGGVR
jgi:hypothetical protein